MISRASVAAAGLHRQVVAAAPRLALVLRSESTAWVQTTRPAVSVSKGMPPRSWRSALHSAATASKMPAGSCCPTAFVLMDPLEYRHMQARRWASTGGGGGRNTGPGRAFVKAFRASVERQVHENKELQTDIKLLSSEASKITESDALRKAREIMEKESSAFKETASKAVTAAVNRAADSTVGKATKATIETTARVIEKAAQPIVESQVYKAVSGNVNRAIHSCGGRYGGFASTEHREAVRLRRVQDFRERHYGDAESPTCEPNLDPKATALAARADSKSSASGGSSRSASALNALRSQVRRVADAAGQRLAASDNLAILWGRWAAARVGNKVAALLEETDTARAFGRIKEMDPSFQIDAFLSDVRELIVPELLTSWIVGDVEALRQWCDEAPCATITAGHAELARQGLYNDSSVFELQNVDITTAKVLDNDVAVVVVSFQTQENIVYRATGTGAIALGKEDHIVLCSYALVLTHREEWQDEVTHGWRVIDAAKHVSGSML